MGITKRMMEDDDHRRAIALKIAVAAKVLAKCEIHDDAIFQGSEDDIKQAYKLGNHWFSNDEGIAGAFDDRTQMTDTIKAVVDDYILHEECSYCARAFEID